MSDATIAATSRRRLIRSVGAVVVAAVAGATNVACAPPPAAPAAAVMRQTPPPWDAPRDAISYIRAAGLEELSSGYTVGDGWVAILTVTVDGNAVEVPANIGMDRVRAIEAPLHTHESTGNVWGEHPSQVPPLTLGDFFDLWGVRFTDDCLGDACGGVSVTIDDEPAQNSGLRGILWAPNSRVVIAAQH